MSDEFRHIVRIAGTDLDGSKRLAQGLTKIKGLDANLANAVVKVAGLDPNMRVGRLTDDDVQKIEGIMKDPSNHGVPGWLLNRRKDLETGRSFHLIGSDLDLRVKSDVNFMKEIRSWKGLRHSLGLKVRGQRTKTTGRAGRTVGVSKKKRMEALAVRGKEAKKR